MGRAAPPETDVFDPKGVIGESYRIPGITASECRSIFLDWAISVPLDQNAQTLIGALLAKYGSAWPDHPMTGVLRDGLGAAPPKGRRGGRQARMAKKS